MTDTAPSTPRIGVVLVAAGSGTRLGRGMPKALVPLAGKPLLEHALRGIIASGVATTVVAVLPPGDEHLRRICADVGRDTGTAITTTAGGAERTDSVRTGIEALGPVDHILVHDAARCLTPPEVFIRIVEALQAGGTAVIPGVAVADTIKVVDPATRPAHGISDAAPVTGTPDRSGLRAIQTPQGFEAGALAAAHAAAAGWSRAEAAEITDDAALMERAGHQVLVVPGDPAAFKITTALDLLLAEAMLAGDRTRDQAPSPTTTTEEPR
ncbi:2-C-methyl-D-erythritol 4-phosphate cytidylyltransferase [Arthrobacter sp.]|uniref:2-C-methyl-D-erythritol 4-phosphate cytidylyltransferase n=1 Tax=Arthrobacter sp. TaxID=1667 RepID=UPI003A94BB60